MNKADASDAWPESHWYWTVTVIITSAIANTFNQFEDNETFNDENTHVIRTWKQSLNYVPAWHSMFSSILSAVCARCHRHWANAFRTERTCDVTLRNESRLNHPTVMSSISTTSIRIRYFQIDPSSPESVQADPNRLVLNQIKIPAWTSIHQDPAVLDARSLF